MAPKKKLKFEYGRRCDRLWYWRVKAGNREIIAQGEGYKRKAGVLKVAEILINGMDEAELVFVDNPTKRCCKCAPIA